MNKKIAITTFVSLILLALPLTAAAEKLPCAMSIQFEPSEITLNRENPELVPVQITYIAAPEGGMCKYTFDITSPNGNSIPSDSIVDTTNGILSIDFYQNDFLAKEMPDNGTYLLEVYDKANDEFKGELTIDLSSGMVLGASHTRGASQTLPLLIGLVVMGGVIGMYAMKKS